jgi:hypothetical protein
MGLAAPAAAQDATPTPAPSKTATPPATADESMLTASPTRAAAPEPWTQEDLSILTGNVQRPNGITWHEGKLYTACNGDYTLYEIDADTAFTRTYIWGVRNAHTLFAETTAQGELSLWVPDFQTNQLVYVERTGVRPIISDLAGPWGIAYVDENRFLVTTLLDNSLLLVDRSSAYETITSDLRSPTGVVVDGAHVYVANTGSARRAIEWLSLETLALGSAAGAALPETQPLVSGLQNTTGLVLGPDGYLYFAYALGTRGVVGRVDPDVCRERGGCSNTDVEIVVFTELAAPLAGLTISPDMRLFVHTMFSPDIYWVQLSNAADPA